MRDGGCGCGRGNTATSRGLGGVVVDYDPCADPLNAGSQYCRERRAGETVAQWNARRAAELEPGAALLVTVREGLHKREWLPWLLVGGLGLILYLTADRRS